MEVRLLAEKVQAEGGMDAEYVGDPTAEFSGLEIRQHPRVVRGYFQVFLDHSWPNRTREFYSPSEAPLEARIEAAIKAGVQGIILSRSLVTEEIKGRLEGVNYFIVRNTFKFYFAASRILRDLNATSKLTAITGSAGKTTTRAMLVHALESSGSGPVLTTSGNQNLYPAVLNNISRMEKYRHTVLEVALSSCRAFRINDHSIRADVSVITSITEAHMSGQNGLANIALAKSEVFTGPPPGGTAVISADAPHAGLMVEMALRAGRQVITYGESPNAAVRLIAYSSSTHLVTAEVGNERVSYRIGAAGRHFALNSLAVIAVLRSYGIAGWREAVESLASFSAGEGRGKSRKVVVGNGPEVEIINAAYNANPASMRAEIETFASGDYGDYPRKVAILGDMLELGDYAEQAHRDVSFAIESARIDVVVIFGQEMAALHDELTRRSIEHVYLPSFDALKGSIDDLLEPGDLVLAKASNSTGLNEWVSKLAPPG